ncbi:MAG: D-alanine--D-alanine ligase [Planctomycetes bacterium]|nr:D-alanine--D-alanine ligase [Planctomycetota bacterium]
MVQRSLHEKLRVAILFGGRSGEHDVSIASAMSVIDTLNRQRYDPLPVYLDQQGNWIPHTTPHNAQKGIIGSATDPFPLLAHQTDIAFPVLHGTHGEDGAIQGLLEMMDVPYVGPGVVASATGMDKAVFKQIMQAHGFPILPWILVTSKQLSDSADRVVERIEAAVSYPVFTKPANLGSSVGISRCNNQTELIAGLEEACCYDHRIVVEQGIRPRELEIAILGNDDPQASTIGEIRPKAAFYSYAAKYVSDDSELLIPAPLDVQLAQQAQKLAIDAYRAIDCAGMARVDLFLSLTDDQLYVNEINTIPGFTEISMYPQLWTASGIGYSELLDQLIALGLERHHEKKTLKRTYQYAPTI